MPHPPEDADRRRAVPPVIVYPTDSLPRPDQARLSRVRNSMIPVSKTTVPPREGRCVDVPKGHVFRISCPEGSQVGDLNLWNAADLSERFFSGKTRALHGTHVSIGDHLWSALPHMRPMATIIYDTLDWYGIDDFGGGVHDVIGTRCDPYTHALLSGGDQYHHCCHSNLTRALADHLRLSLAEAENHVHDVLNVFMCTGFTRDTGQYFMKASPARQGDLIELIARMDLIIALSACPGGNCAATHSSDDAACHPLQIDVFEPTETPFLSDIEIAKYNRSHGR